MTSSPGASTGMPGGYGATSSTLTRPTASAARRVSHGAKYAARGDIRVTGSTAYTGDEVTEAVLEALLLAQTAGVRVAYAADATLATLRVVR